MLIYLLDFLLKSSSSQEKSTKAGTIKKSTVKATSGSVEAPMKDSSVALFSNQCIKSNFNGVRATMAFLGVSTVIVNINNDKKSTALLKRAVLTGFLRLSQ